MIDIAEKFVDSEDYRKAEKLYLDASKSYSRYDENYRQSKDRYYEIKEKADLIDAEKSYNLGLAEVRKKTKSSYRKAVDYFEQAAKLVTDYRDSKELARKYESMGTIDYYISGCPASLENYIADNLSKIGNKRMSSGYSDVVISCDVDTNYKISKGYPKTQSHSEMGQARDKNGMYVIKEFIFEDIKTVSTETIDVKYRISLKGLENRSFSGSFSVSNNYSEINYKGDVPEKYKSLKEYPLGKDEMKNKAFKSMDQKAHAELEELIRIIKNI